MWTSAGHEIRVRKGFLIPQKMERRQFTPAGGGQEPTQQRNFLTLRVKCQKHPSFHSGSATRLLTYSTDGAGRSGSDCPGGMSAPVSVQFSGAAVDVAGVEDFPTRTGVIDIAAHFALQAQLLRSPCEGIGIKRQITPAAVFPACVAHARRRTQDEISAAMTF
jgi:hypothetical protein